MKNKLRKLLSAGCVLALVLGLLPLSAGAAGAGSFSAAGGWFESLYAELSGVSDSDVTAVSYDGPISGALEGDDLTYLVRDMAGGGVRIDIPGLKPGSYTLTATAGGSTYTKENLQVMAYDRSGYAHWNYTEGVGAYNDDGTLKDNALVLYVTDENKEEVSLSSGNGKLTVKGIGNILNNASDNSKKYLFANLTTIDQRPLVVRFVGNVTAPTGLTEWKDSDPGTDNGDNGSMAVIKNGSNITLEGIGADAVINGWGFSFGLNTGEASKGLGKNFEVRNLTFRNAPEDCVGIEGQASDMTRHTWVHNCAFYVPHVAKPAAPDKKEGDGACDFKRSEYFTMSYNYFEGYHKTNLVGSGDNVKQYHITWHHNWWKNCQSRGPLGRQANMHIYNCIYEGQTSYCMNARANCYIFSEYNTFKSCNNPMQLVKDEGNGPGGPIKSYKDVFTGCKGDKHGTIVTDKSQKLSSTNPYASFELDPKLSYIPDGDYALDESVETAKENIDAFAGPMKAAASIVIPGGHQHSWGDWTQTKAPTCTEAGEKTRNCANTDGACAKPVQTQTIPALGHNYVDNVCTRCGDKLAGKVFTLTGGEVFAQGGSIPGMVLGGNATYPGSYSAASAATVTAGSEDFFTLLFTEKSRLDPNERTFDDGYQATHRINFNGAASTSANAVSFTLQGPAAVKVWWVGAVSAEQYQSGQKELRPMVILDAAGKEAAAPSETVANDVTPMLSTFELSQAGTYYLGGKGGKNFIHKVEVVMAGGADPAPAYTGTLGQSNELEWAVSADETTLSITAGAENLGAEDMVLAACRDAAGQFIGAAIVRADQLEAQLPEGFSIAKLLWLGAGQAPKCHYAEVGSGK